jgi:outer membrane immunogenic protein
MRCGRIIGFVCAGAWVALAATAAVADFAPVSLPWTGTYIGVHGGWGEGRSKPTFNEDGHYNNSVAESFTYHVRGAIAGAHAGFNHQTGQYVLGIEGSLAWSGVKKNNAVSPLFVPPALTDYWTTKVSWLATLTPRIGVVTNNGLVYVKGGLAVGRVFNHVTDLNDFFEDARNKFGWTAGVGFEYRLAPKAILGFEYNYVDLGKPHFAGPLVILPGGTPPLAQAFTDHNLKVTIHSFLARLSVPIGWP